MTLETKNLDTPDETRSFEHGSMNVVNIAGATVGRAVFNPGWKWSNDVKPIVGDEPCVMLDWSGSANYAKPAR